MGSRLMRRVQVHMVEGSHFIAKGSGGKSLGGATPAMSNGKTQHPLSPTRRIRSGKKELARTSSESSLIVRHPRFSYLASACVSPIVEISKGRDVLSVNVARG